MNKVKKKSRRLNAEQLEVLSSLYRFRFGSNDLFAQYFGKKDRSFVYKRLSILLEQGLIGKRFDSSYRIQGKPAAYFLTPTGARLLQEHAPDKPVNIKMIYKNTTVKDDFVDHCMRAFAVNNLLSSQYGEALRLFTKSELNQEQFDYFPRPLPDAFLSYRDSTGTRRYFLESLEDTVPAFVIKRRIKLFTDYYETDEWEATGSNFPAILIICESPAKQSQVEKHVISILRNTQGDELLFALTHMQALKSSSESWRVAGEDDLVSLAALGT